MFTSARPVEESLFSKLAKIPRSLLLLFFATVVFIESTALLALVFHVNTSAQLGSKRIFTSRQEPPSSSWKLYENKSYKFAFKYPPEMTQDQAERPGIVARFFLFENPYDKSSPIINGLLLNMEISPYQTSQDAANFISSYFQRESTKIVTETTVIGQLVPAEIVHIEEAGSSTIVENIYVFVKLRSGEVLEMQMFWTGKESDKYETIANQILATFKLIN
jgi:hypothetical protein